MVFFRKRLQNYLQLCLIQTYIMSLLFCRFLHWLHTLQLHDFYKSRQDQSTTHTHATEADSHTTKADTVTTEADSHTAEAEESTKDQTDVKTIAVTDLELKC